MNPQAGPIGIFDSGYGGLTILGEITRLLPQYDYIYLGDNARTPYGTRSFEVIQEYTHQAVCNLFGMGCHLVILACNTASAKALRTIQQRYLPQIDPQRRVLGVIRPSVEEVPLLTQTNHVGILATPGTVSSESYPLEIEKLTRDRSIVVTQEACPMWVPIVENQEMDTPGAHYFIRTNIGNLLKKDPLIDTIILGCTHYPLLKKQIKSYLPSHVKLIEQGSIVAAKLEDYLQRHPEMQQKCTTGGTVSYYTTESVDNFEKKAGEFTGLTVTARQIHID